jgi:hypothetical protein
MDFYICENDAYKSVDTNNKKFSPYILKASIGSEIICLKEYHRKRYAEIVAMDE